VSFRHLRNARGFFSDYYLGSVFGNEVGRRRSRKLSDKATELSAARFRRLYDRTVAGRQLTAYDCRERFVRPLLRDVFGLLLDDGPDGLQRVRPADDSSGSEIAEPQPAVALAWIGGSSDDLDTKSRKASPADSVVRALSREGLRFGLLSSGERIRLVRAAGEGPPGAYLEVDLAGLAEDPDPESFAAALRLFSADSFVPGKDGVVPLEAYERESRKHAEKVSEDLKTAVFSAAQALIRGLLVDTEERGVVEDRVSLTPAELAGYRDAALLALYRLLFILYAEARDPRLDQHRLYRLHYSASGLVDELLSDPLRSWPENRSSLWARCLALFEIYDRGLPPIDPWRNIPPRGGDFFSRETPEGRLLATARLSDATVARLMLDLATTAPRRGVGRERVSFRELDIENLGAVYEGLLEYEPQVAAETSFEIRVQGRVFVLSAAETARLCTVKKLLLKGPLDWVAGTPAERFHPQGEAEEAAAADEAEEEAGAEEDEDEQDEEGVGDELEEAESDGAGAGGAQEQALKKGGAALLLARHARGAFHFVPGPGRKGSGSFYTPLPLVQDLVRGALGPVAIGRMPAEIEALRVVDPACGSGHFLVEAMRFLGRELHRAYVREYGGKAPPGFRGTVDEARGWDVECEISDPESRASASEARAWCKRRIAERCLFGVDRNPTAVQLARVALWIESAAGDRPLTYFEHHVRCGNSLLGSWLDRLDAPPVSQADDRQKDAFADKLQQDFKASMAGLDARVAEARRRRELIDEATPEDLEREGIEAESIEELVFKKGLQAEAEQLLAGAKLLFDLRSASLFLPEIWRDWRGLALEVTDPAAAEAAAQRRAWWPGFQELREHYRFFHWELEFPEVFLAGNRSGFDAVVGNPPWDKVLPERHTFYARVDPLIRAFKGSDLDQRIVELEAAHPGLREEFQEFQLQTKLVAQYLRAGGDFPLAEARSQSAHEDVSKYFLDRGIRLAGKIGSVAYLVPSVVYNGDGCVGLRRHLLSEGRIERFYGFENRRKLFPIDSRYKFAVLVFRAGAEPAPFEAAFMRHDPEELVDSGSQSWRVRLSREEVERYSPETLAFLEYRSPRDQEIVAKMHAGRPTLGAGAEEEGSWGVRFVSWRAHEVIFNASEDKDLWTGPKTGKFYTPASVLGEEPADVDETFERMRDAGFWPVFEGKHIDQFLAGVKPIRWWLSVAAAQSKYGKKPRAEATLVFRETASNTNERTCIAVVLPERSAASHTLSGALFAELAPSQAASVLNSFCFDYALRLRTAGTHISFTYLNPMPVPPVQVARRLPALPTRLAWRGGLRHITDQEELWPQLWAANRAVAEAYGLDAEDFEHILSSFPGVAKKRKAFFAFLGTKTAEWRAESERLGAAS
jgi:hypothetical protein